jgi:hypothetical protein
MLNLRDPHLASRPFGSTLDASTQVDLDTTGEMFSTVLEFNMYASGFTTENNRWSSQGPGEPGVELASEYVFLYLQNIIEHLPMILDMTLASRTRNYNV